MKTRAAIPCKHHPPRRASIIADKVDRLAGAKFAFCRIVHAECANAHTQNAESQLGIPRRMAQPPIVTNQGTTMNRVRGKSVCKEDGYLSRWSSRKQDIVDGCDAELGAIWTRLGDVMKLQAVLLPFTLRDEGLGDGADRQSPARSLN